MSNPNRLDLSEHLQRLAPKTQRLYTRWIQRYLGDTYQVEANRFNLSKIRPEIIISVLEPARLQDWLHALHQRDLSGATIVQARSAIIWLAGALTSSAHLHAYQAGALNLVKPPIQTERTAQQWLTPIQSRKLLEALQRQDQPPAIRARNIAIITVMLTCGLRREEVIEARWGDIEGERLKVRGKGGKMRKPEHSRKRTTHRQNVNTEGKVITKTAKDCLAFYASLTDEQFMLMVCMGVVLSDYSAALTNKRVAECVESRFPDLARLVLDGLIRPACPSDDQLRTVTAAMHRLIRAAIAEANG